MNTGLFNLIKEHKEFTMNTTVLRGYTQEALEWRSVMAHIEQNIRDTYEGVLDGLVFEGLSRLPLAERIKESMVKLGNPTYLPYDQTDTYYLKAQFSYKGKKLKPHVIKVPFLRDGGLTVIRNSKYYVSPVLVDSGISIHKAETKEGKQQAFLWIQRSNLQVNVSPVRIKVNGELRGQRLIEMDLNQAPKRKRQVPRNHPRRMDVSTPAVIYLLIKHGLFKAAKEFFDLDLIISDEPLEVIKEDYSFNDWIVCQADDFKPQKLNAERWKEPTLSLIIPRNRWTHDVAAFLTGVLYLVNWFPKTLTAENLMEEGDQTLLWKFVCGDVMYNTGDSDAVLLEKVERHLSTSVELMINPITSNELRNDGIDVYDMYELIAYLIKNVIPAFNYKKVNDLHEKKLSCMRYFLQPFTDSITRASYNLANLKEAIDRGEDISLDKLHEMIGSKKQKFNGLKTTLFDKIANTSGMFNPEQSASDNMYFKITCKMIPQDKHGKGRGKGNANRGQLNSPKNFYHPSYLTIGRTIFQPKKNPTGGGEINPFIEITPSGHFKEDSNYQWLTNTAKQHLALNDTTVDGILTDELTQDDIKGLAD